MLRESQFDVKDWAAFVVYGLASSRIPTVVKSTAKSRPLSPPHHIPQDWRARWAESLPERPAPPEGLRELVMLGNWEGKAFLVQPYENTAAMDTQENQDCMCDPEYVLLESP